MTDGNRQNVLVLTRPAGYRKTVSRMAGLIRLRYPHYRGLCRAFAVRARRYNRSMQQIERLEAAGTVFVIRPRAALKVKRTESDVRKLEAIYARGYRDAAEREAALAAYLQSAP
jgi:predicted patatin/cPLA2 family phospholipase